MGVEKEGKADSLTYMACHGSGREKDRLELVCQILLAFVGHEREEMPLLCWFEERQQPRVDQ